MKSPIFCLIKEPTKPVKFAIIPNRLHAFQEAVGGYIELFIINSRIGVLCNEEGRLQNLPYCCSIGGNHFVGTVVIVGLKGEDFADLKLTAEDIKEVIPADDLYHKEVWPC